MGNIRLSAPAVMKREGFDRVDIEHLSSGPTGRVSGSQRWLQCRQQVHVSQIPLLSLCACILLAVKPGETNGYHTTRL